MLGKVIFMASRFRAKAVQFAIVAFLLVSSTAAWADEGRVSKKSGMAFAVIEIPPYGYRENSSGLRGIYYDILTEAIKRRDRPISLEVIPTKRLLNYMDEGRIACSIFLAVDFVKNRYEKIAPVGRDLRSIILAAKGQKLTVYDDLKGRRVAITRGIVYGHKVDDDPSIERIITKDYDQSMKMLKAGRVDAVVGTDVSLLYLLKKSKIDPAILPKPLVLNSKSIHLWCAKGALSDAEKGSFEGIFSEMQKDGTLKKIWDTYLSH